MNWKLAIYRALRAMGLKVERFRDPLDDLKILAGPNVSRVIDGGAYRGTVSQKFLELFPAADVHAFEPQPDLYQSLVSMAAESQRLHVHNQALAESQDEAVFHVPEAAFTGSLLTPGQEFGAARDITVQTTTLDLWVREHGPVDVLKLDLQGAELKALKGAREMLAQVAVILCEVNFVARYDDCALFHEIASFLAQHNFNLHRLYEIRTRPDGSYAMADAIFRRRSGSTSK